MKIQKDGPIQKRTENFYNKMGCKAEKQKERNTREIKMHLENCEIYQCCIISDFSDYSEKLFFKKKNRTAFS